jgi:hypothetical protein
MLAFLSLSQHYGEPRPRWISRLRDDKEVQRCVDSFEGEIDSWCHVAGDWRSRQVLQDSTQNLSRANIAEIARACVRSRQCQVLPTHIQQHGANSSNKQTDHFQEGGREELIRRIPYRPRRGYCQANDTLAPNARSMTTAHLFSVGCPSFRFERCAVPVDGDQRMLDQRPKLVGLTRG